MVRIVASSWTQLVRKQDWNTKRECPALKTLLWEVFFTFGGSWAGLLCAGLQSWSFRHMDQGLAESKSLLPFKHWAWVPFSLNAVWQQSWDRLESCPDRVKPWPENGPNWGSAEHTCIFGLQDNISNFITSLCLCASPAATGRTE